ncbi:MAG: DNA polymerase III subunit beta [Bacilli bacterium]|nr:DNA polymerase III subunit beta [Bacilli bacterium]
MNFIIKQNILMEQLNNAIKGVSNKNLIPILNCIKFELTKDGLYLLSTDNEMAIRTFLPKEKIEEIISLGEVVVSGRYIYEIVKKLPNEVITIEEVAGSKLFITTTNTEFNLNCNNANDFPNLELETKENPIVITEADFKAMVNQTSFASSLQESRPILTGINFLIRNSSIECTATDSYRLSKRKIDLKSTEEENNLIIPNRTLVELTKLLVEDENEMEMHIFTNKVIFRFDNIEFLTRLISGTFPDTEKLIPESFELELKVSYRDIFGAIDRASLLSSGDDKNTLLFELKNDVIKISSNIPEIGMVEEKIKVVDKKGDDLTISFSSKFMTDALRAINSEFVVLKFNGDIKPIIIVDPNNTLLTELIVPIRTY